MIRQFNQDFPSPATYDSQAESTAADVLQALGRIEDPVAVLAAPDAVASKPYLEAMRHFARGQATLRLGRVGDARLEAAQVTLPWSYTPPKGSVRPVVVEVAQSTLQGEIALANGNAAAAAASFTKAATLQESRLGAGGDPPVWAWPVRRALAAARLASGDAPGAAREASAALAAWKLDPLSLAVRAAAERAMGEAEAAAKDEAAARAAWHGPPADLSVAAAA
jgi:hypothetical protein